MSYKTVEDEMAQFYAYGALGVQALLPIVAGSLASVKVSIRRVFPLWISVAVYLNFNVKSNRGTRQTPKSVTKRAKKTAEKTIADPDDSDDEDDEEQEERIGLSDSLLFPVVASVTLLSLFLVFKYLDPLWINRIIGLYCELQMSVFHG